MVPDGEITPFVIHLPEKFGGDVLELLPGTRFSDVKQKGYFNVVADGPKCRFLRTYETRLVLDPQHLYSKDFRIFEQYNEYFIFQKSTNAIHKIKLREKDVREVLGAVTFSDGVEWHTVNGIKKAVTEVNHQ